MRYFTFDEMAIFQFNVDEIIVDAINAALRHSRSRGHISFEAQLAHGSSRLNHEERYSITAPSQRTRCAVSATDAMPSSHYQAVGSRLDEERRYSRVA